MYFIEKKINRNKRKKNKQAKRTQVDPKVMSQMRYNREKSFSDKNSYCELSTCFNSYLNNTFMTITYDDTIFYIERKVRRVAAR